MNFTKSKFELETLFLCNLLVGRQIKKLLINFYYRLSEGVQLGGDQICTI